jgi:hypothetical protein
MKICSKVNNSCDLPEITPEITPEFILNFLSEFSRELNGQKLHGVRRIPWGRVFSDQDTALE